MRCRSLSARASVYVLLTSTLFSTCVFFWSPLSCSADQLGELTRPVEGDARRASSGLFDPESNRDPYHLRGGQRRILADLEGPGEIRHIWFTISSRDRRYPRNLVLRIYYDHSKTPSVETPIGDFFVAGNGMRANVSSKPIETSSYGRALNCYWRIPFKRHCRIEAHNQGQERMTVYFQGDWLKLDSLPSDVLYFHARYRQEYPAKPFSPYTVFEGEGEGQYVGTVFSSQNTVASWFGEADDRFYVDGEEEPSIVGTGTEDYFNDAWNLRLTSNQRVGTTICEVKGEERRITAYRWHIDDPIPFKKSLKFEIERRSFTAITDPKTGKRMLYDFKYRPDYWSSVSYWYQKGIARPLWEFPSAEERLLPEVWVEPAWIVDQVRASEGMKPRRLSNRTCNLKQFFFMKNDSLGSWVEFPLRLPKRGSYAASIFPNLFQDRGVWKITLRGPDAVEIILDPGVDCFDNYLSRKENYPENAQHGTTREIKLGTHHLNAGDYWIRFTCVGANPQTRDPRTGEFGKGMSLGLDAINFRRLPVEYPAEWIKDYLQKEKKLFAQMDEQTIEQIRVFSQAINQFHAREGRYPEKLEDLVERNILSGKKGLFRDAWGQRVQYRSPGVVRPWAFDVYSFHGASRDPSVWFGNWKNPFQLRNESKGIVLEGETLTVSRSNGGVRSSVQRIESEGAAPISGDKHLFIRLNKPGDWAEIELPASLPAGRYKAYLFFVTASDYGKSQWSLAGRPLGKSIDGYTPDLGMRSAAVGTLEVGSDSPKLRIEATGKAEYSGGYYAGLDAIVLLPMR